MAGQDPSGAQCALTHAQPFGLGSDGSPCHARDYAKREYAYGPVRALPAIKVSAFSQALCDEAKKQGWTVIRMKNEWKRIFAFEQ